MADIKAIETFYNGYKFRSRLEARWAVFFDALGIEYEYESEGYKLGYGIRYLPDFKVKCYGLRGEIKEEPTDLYIEVKGVMDSSSAYKIKHFASQDALIDYYCKECEYVNSVLENIDISLRAEVGEALIKSYREKNPIPEAYSLLIVNTIPNITEKCNCYDSDIFKCYDDFGYRTYLFNYETIDGDYFGAYPSITEDGKFFLMGDDSSYIWCGNWQKLIDAYQTARMARFEYGETPTIGKNSFNVEVEN